MNPFAAQLPILIAALAALTATGVVTALAWPRLAGRGALARRIDEISRDVLGGMAEAADADRADGKTPAKRSVRDTLREVEEVRRARSRRALIRRLREAGLGWSKRRYYAFSLGLGALGLGLGLLLNGGLVVIAGLAIGGGVGLPHLILSIRRKTRTKAMTAEFPTAIDIVVRGVKSGLPFQSCLRIIAQEIRDPLKSEFEKIINDLNVGLPMSEAVQRFAERVPLSEANFFAIVITIQARTGGSLSDSLQNLSNVLRERNKMRGKIKAMSSEAKASGAIIGALPVVVTAIMFLTSPDYISVLFTETTGNMVLAGSAIWMSIGVLVMRKMIDFDF